MECSFLPKAINYSFLYYDIIYAIQGCLLLINNTMIINFSLASLNVLRVASSSLEFSLIIISSSRYGTNQGAIDIRMIQAFKTTVWIQIRYNGNKFFNDKYAETCCKRIHRIKVLYCQHFMVYRHLNIIQGLKGTIRKIKLKISLLILLLSKQYISWWRRHWCE